MLITQNAIYGLTHFLRSVFNFKFVPTGLLICARKSSNPLMLSGNGTRETLSPDQLFFFYAEIQISLLI